jgi:hypothetical protein
MHCDHFPNVARIKNPDTKNICRIQTERDGIHIHVNVNTPHRTLHGRQNCRVCGLDGSVWAREDNFWRR